MSSKAATVSLPIAVPVITSLNESSAIPGDTIVITGQNFGSTQGSGYVHFADNGVNWGEPGNAAVFQLLSWSNTQISFILPVRDSRGWQTTPGSTATVSVTNNSGFTSNTMNISLNVAPVITSVSPASGAPGTTVVINGSRFGVQQSTGYVHFADNGVNWGEPGNVAAFQLLNWSDTQIRFNVPVKDSNGWQTTPGTTATITVTNSDGITSNAVSFAIPNPAPVLNSLSSTSAIPGDTIVISGQGFGSSQGSGFVHFADNGINWGEPGNAATFQLLSWSNTQISFIVPVKDPSGWQTAGGSTATVTVVNSSGLASNSLNLALNVTPAITSLSASQAAPGNSITIFGSRFGVQQSTGYVHIANNGINWGEPGNAAMFQVVSWADTQVVFLVPVRDSNGFQVSPGSSATITVTNADALTSNSVSLALTSGVSFPVSYNTGQSDVGLGWYMQTSVTIDSQGNLTGAVHSWVDSLNPTGFKAAAGVVLYGVTGNMLSAYGFGPYGVNGFGGNRTDSISASVPVSVLNQLGYIAVANSDADNWLAEFGSVLNWLLNNSQTLFSAGELVALTFG
jgi:hypothetical protein